MQKYKLSFGKTTQISENKESVNFINIWLDEKANSLFVIGGTGMGKTTALTKALKQIEDQKVSFYDDDLSKTLDLKILSRIPNEFERDRIHFGNSVSFKKTSFYENKDDDSDLIEFSEFLSNLLKIDLSKDKTHLIVIDDFTSLTTNENLKDEIENKLLKILQTRKDVYLIRAELKLEFIKNYEKYPFSVLEVKRDLETYERFYV